MYDIGQAKRQGLAARVDAATLETTLADVAAQRWAEVDGAERTFVIGTPEVLTAASTVIDREFYDYYRTSRGQHPRATTAFARTSDAQMSLFWSYERLSWISPRPVLFITGDQAHSRIFSEHAYARAAEPKELLVVPGAGHVDLYDRVHLIPWDHAGVFPHAGACRQGVVMTNPLDFTGKVALVTGAAAGMGLATARAFAEAGAAVVLADVSERAVSGEAEKLVAAGHRALGVRCDVSDDAEVAAMVKRTVSEFGQLDAAFNNAGVMAEIKPVAESCRDEWDRVIGINLRGVWSCMKQELRQMQT